MFIDFKMSFAQRLLFLVMFLFNSVHAGEGLILVVNKGAMMPPSEKMMEIKKLIEQARFHPAAAMPTETHQSYPIPLKFGDRLRVAFLYCPSRVSPQFGLQLVAPNYIATLDVESGKFEEMRAAAPNDFGQPHKEAELIGKYPMPEGMNPEQFIAAQAELYRAYDILLPMFAGNAVVPADVKDTARRFKSLFSQIAEPPLLPYYQSVGKEFFAWVERLTI